MSGKRSKRRRKDRSGVLLKLAGLLVIMAAFAALFASVFQLENLVVRGNIHMTANEVKAVVLTPATAGNTVLTKLFNTGRTVKGTGFIERIDTTIVDRGTVAVRVREHRFVGVYKDNDIYCYLLGDGTVQAEATERSDKEQLPLIEGVTLNTSVTLGDVLPVQGNKLFVLLDSLRSMTDLYEIVPDKVIFQEDGTMALVYGGVTALMGDGTNLDGRMKELAGILAKMNGAYQGTLHLEQFERSGNPIVFDQK